MASDLDAAPLVGRADHGDAAVRAARRRRAGQTAAVFVTGESGVGKSRLLREIG